MTIKPPPRASTSWGDLLLFQALPGASAQAAAAASLLGLPAVTLPEPALKDEAIDSTLEKRKKPPPAQPARQLRLPLRMPSGFVAHPQQKPLQTAKALDLPPWNAAEALEVEAMLEPGGPAPRDNPSLLSMEQSLRACRIALSTVHTHGLHMERTVAILAQGQWPVPLPMQTRRSGLQKVHICVDMHPARQFLVDDYHAFLHALRQSFPALRLDIHEMEDARSWAAFSDTAAASGVTTGSMVMLLCESALLPMNERARLSSTQRVWQRNGAKVVRPLSWQTRALPDGDSEPAHGDTPMLAQLLACLAPAVTVEPALVRGMVAALGWPASLRLEQAVWTHSALDGALPFRQWYAAQQRQHLRALQALPPATQDISWRVIASHHTHRHQVQRDQELLNWVSASGPDGEERLQQAQACQDAKTRYARVAQHLLKLLPQNASGHRLPQGSGGVLRAAAHERLQSLPECLQAHPQISDMLAKVALHTPDAAASQPAPDSVELPTMFNVALRVQGKSICMARDGTLTKPGVTLAEVELSGDWISVERGGRPNTLSLVQPRAAHQALVLHRWSRTDELVRELRCSGPAGTLRVEAIDRPHWAASFRQVNKGLQALLHIPNGLELGVDYPPPSSGIHHSVFPEYRIAFDPYGPRLTLPIYGIAALNNLETPVALRYLPPATFLMGSPEGEGFDDEHPQHPVTLTQSLWLAETPCTQALWQAVMGNNPSHFKQGPDAPQRPVENVSWDDVQQFLKKLTALLPEGCEAVLPTEAQWEYACRAGTLTAYSWGDAPDASKANMYMGNNRTGNEEKGTTPVDQYPPNPWGLRDMHGNVWEWCADDQRNYGPDPVRDPSGGTGGDARVVRGGSWIYHPYDARSAYRDGRPGGTRRHYLGFRFALRSSRKGGADAPVPGGHEAQAGASKGVAAGRRAAGAGASGNPARSTSQKKGAV